MEDRPLDAVEVRVLGALIEKEATTPDYYPLTLNALVAACNQKSNRDPVLALEETDVVRALDRLRPAGWVLQTIPAGSKVPKYKHFLDEKLGLDAAATAVLAELMLRGPQTAGELRTRAGRMVELGSVEDVLAVVEALMEREPPLAVRLPRLPGQKEARHAHLLAGEPELEPAEPTEPARLKVAAEEERTAALEQRIVELERRLDELAGDFQAFREQFE